MSDLAHRYRVEFINGQHMVIRANSPKDAMTHCGLWYGLRAVSAELLKGTSGDVKEANETSPAGVN